MMEKFVIYNNAVHGHKISEYGLKHGYLDYRTLACIVGDMILNNTVMNVRCDSWELENGSVEYFYDEDGNDISEEDYYDMLNNRKDAYEGYHGIYQTYIISDHGAEILKTYTDEIVYYSDELDMHVWCITHFGTSWDYVLTNIKIDEMQRL